MRFWRKALVAVVLAPALAIGGYVAYLATTYIDEATTTGSAYGFEIGSTKRQALDAVLTVSRSNPRLVTYVTYGPRAGDHFTLKPSPQSLEQLQAHDQWKILLDGPGKFFNVVRLTFHDGRLVRIYRHRKHFELP